MTDALKKLEALHLEYRTAGDAFAEEFSRVIDGPHKALAGAGIEVRDLGEKLNQTKAAIDLQPVFEREDIARVRDALRAGLEALDTIERTFFGDVTEPCRCVLFRCIDCRYEHRGAHIAAKCCPACGSAASLNQVFCHEPECWRREPEPARCTSCVSDGSSFINPATSPEARGETAWKAPRCRIHNPENTL